MKKTLTIFRISFLAAIALLTVTCGKTGSGDYRNLIPDDALLTVSFNGNSLMEKAGFSDAERAALKGQAQLAMRYLGGALSEEDGDFILSVLDSPDNSGLSFKEDMYFSIGFEDMDGEPENMHMSYLAKISDTKKFEKLVGILKTLAPEVEIRSEGSLNVIVLDENLYNTSIIAYDRNAVMYLMTYGDYPSTVAHASGLFKGTNKIAGNKLFSKFTEGKSDFGMLFNYGPMISMIESQIPGEFPYIDMLAHAYICTSTQFEKGRIDTDVDFIFTDKESEKKFEEFYDRPGVNGKYTEYLSENAIFAMTGYFQGSKTYETLLKLPQTSIIGFVPEAKSLFEAFEGEIFLSLSDFGRHGISGSFLATINDPSILENMVGKIDSYVDIVKEGDNYYTIDYDGFQAEFGVRGDIFYLSTDSEVLAALDGHSLDNPQKEIVSLFRKGNGAFYIDFDNLGEAILDNYWYSDYVDHQTAAMLEIMGMFKNAYANIEDDVKKAKIVINMTDQDKNSLAVIADKIREHAIGSMF